MLSSAALAPGARIILRDCEWLIRKTLKASAGSRVVIELDIKKCFDRISHSCIMENLIAPKGLKLGIFRCLKAGTNVGFPDQGCPQGGVCSPLLANIALNGIENIHHSIRYADDMLFILKPKNNAEAILNSIQELVMQLMCV